MFSKINMNKLCLFIINCVNFQFVYYAVSLIWDRPLTDTKPEADLLTNKISITHVTTKFRLSNG